MTETIDFAQVGLLLGLAAARDQRTVGEADTLAWHQDLNAAGITYADAEAALTHFYAVTMAALQPRDRRRITTPDIISIARRIRRERLENFRYEPSPNETTGEYLRRLRGQIAAVASGQTPVQQSNVRQLEGGPHPAVARALAGVGRAVPDGDGAPAESPGRPPRLGPLSVRCPECQAPVGRKCRSGTSGHWRRPHRARRDAARVAGGQTPEPREDATVLELRRAAAGRHLADEQNTPKEFR